MAIRSSLRCEIRAVVLHLWPDEIKVHPHVRVTIPVGRRGQPVQKLRYMPLAQAHKVLAEVEALCGIWLAVRAAGAPKLLDAAQMAAVIEKFRTYGQSQSAA